MEGHLNSSGFVNRMLLNMRAINAHGWQGCPLEIEEFGRVASPDSACQTPDRVGRPGCIPPGPGDMESRCRGTAHVATGC